MRRTRQALVCWLGFAAVACCALAAGASTAAASVPVCSGTPEAPGVLTGTFPTNVIIEGACVVNGGPAVVRGELTLRPGAVLLAAFALNHRTGSGPSRLTVNGNVRVQSGATLILGCDPRSFACIDDPEREAPTLSSPGRVFGNVSEQEPLGVVVHNTIINGNVRQAGGGGGLNCEPSGIFASFKSPVYSAYEDSTIRGTLNISGLRSCWLGIARDAVGGNVRVVDNQLADPDAIEILANRISGNLTCRENSMVWNSAEEKFESLFPRVPMPNTVNGKRAGDCVLSSPATEGGPPGEGPF